MLNSLRIRWRSRRDPRAVFTPTAVVKEEMFARRLEDDLDGKPGLQDSLESALLNPGEQVVMYGDTGVGKSSLLRYAARTTKRSYVPIECLSKRSYEALMQDCIGRLVDFTEVQFTDTTTISTTSGGAIGAPKVMSVEGSVKAEHGRTRQFSAVKKEPADVLLAAMQAAGRTLVVLDNFQNVDDQEARMLIGQTMERFSDRSGETGDVKLVVIGIADDAASLLARSGSVTRRTTEIGVPRMPDLEIRQILNTGLGLLGLHPMPGVLEKLVFFSDGFPFFAHLLGRSVALAARQTKSREVTKQHVTSALQQAATQVNKSYESRVRLALEAGGETQPRRRLLELLAYDDARDWTSSEVVDLFKGAHGDRDNWSFLLSALAALMKEERGTMLKRTGTAGKYRYAFADPHMRPYLRVAIFPRFDIKSN